MCLAQRSRTPFCLTLFSKLFARLWPVQPTAGVLNATWKKSPLMVRHSPTFCPKCKPRCTKTCSFCASLRNLLLLPACESPAGVVPIATCNPRSFNPSGTFVCQCSGRSCAITSPMLLWDVPTNVVYHRTDNIGIRSLPWNDFKKRLHLSLRL